MPIVIGEDGQWPYRRGSRHQTLHRMTSRTSRTAIEWQLFAAGGGLLTLGGLAWLSHAAGVAAAAWLLDTLIGVVVSTAVTTQALLRRQPSVDVVALLALVGALLVGEFFAGAMISVMLLSGRLLDARAEARAQRDLRLLADRVPRRARRAGSDGDLEEVPVEQLGVGDRIVVRAGEIVPVDGRLGGPGVFDESALTGESLPVTRAAGELVRSGVVNAGNPVELVCAVTAAESTYAGLLRLVDQAQAAGAPFVRLADRLAAWFVPLTLLVAGAAWAISGRAPRAVAVLVVATPCPLLLAAPIALMSGLSRAARNGIIVKGGAALERLAQGRVVLFDKTGTLTRGQPHLTSILIAEPTGSRPASAPLPRSPAELLFLAASLDQLSPHVLATAVVTAALRDGLAPSVPQGVHEVHGQGIEGTVDHRRVRLGKAEWALGAAGGAWAAAVRRRAELDAALTVFVSVDGAPAGALLFTDPLRPDAARLVRTLRANGIERVVLVTGDRPDVAAYVALVVTIDEVHAGCDPAGKLAIVRQESGRAPTVMVGDGINDAPALAAAGAGVALAAHGATAASETADVVLVVDRVDALASAVGIARSARRTAVRAATVGMGLSAVAMAFASVGLLPAAAGAALQEGIDVAAILIALGALRGGPPVTPALSLDDRDLLTTLHSEHESIRPLIDQIPVVADGLCGSEPDLAEARALVERLAGELVPHERSDERILIPLVSRALRSIEATAPLSRGHAEIEQQVGRLQLLLSTLPPEGPTASDLTELRRDLYGLHATIRLHNAQEEEGASSVE